MKRLIIALCLAFSAISLSSQVLPTWESINQRGYPQWFSDAKLGIFIHWGVYSVPAFASKEGYAEWYYRGLMTNDDRKAFQERVYGKDFQYEDFVPMWKAELWNPDEWAELFKKSGAKYVLLVSKHHDGYCLWPSRYSPGWNSVETGPHRDICGELTEAQDVPALGHDYQKTAAKVTWDATHNGTGYVEYTETCKNDSKHTRKTTVRFTPDDEDVDYTVTHTEKVTKEPTCKAEGEWTYESTFEETLPNGKVVSSKDTFNNKIEKADHAWGNPVKEKVKPATCTEDGSYELAVYCKWCGKDHSDGFFQKIVAFFHNIFAKLFGAKFKPDGTPVQK